jgi:hypothetical protein
MEVFQGYLDLLNGTPLEPSDEEQSFQLLHSVDKTRFSHTISTYKAPGVKLPKYVDMKDTLATQDLIEETQGTFRWSISHDSFYKSPKDEVRRKLQISET